MILHYDIYNNECDQWIVFIHGIGGSTLTWKKQIDDFSKEYNLLLIDLPGHGLSQFDNCCVDIDVVCDEIKEVLNTEQIESATFVGMSMGTIVIAHFAVLHPSYVNAIVFGGAAIKINGSRKGLMNFAQLIKKVVPFKMMYTTFAFIMLPKKNHEKSRQIFLREILKMKKEFFINWMSYLKEIMHPDNLLKALDALHIKTLFVSGDEDGCFVKGAKDAAKMLHAQFATICHCGHVCTIEKYKEFNAIALDYLRKLREPQSLLV